MGIEIWSLQLKQPRILNLLQESRPEENEVKSEAAFQRLIASVSELPMQPRTPRAVSDRGRYPEEAGQEESQREETPSDDDGNEGSTFAFLQSSEPINVLKPCTPANSVNGDEMSMLISESPGGPMDIDVVSLAIVPVRLNTDSIIASTAYGFSFHSKCTCPTMAVHPTSYN